MGCTYAKQYAAGFLWGRSLLKSKLRETQPNLSAITIFPQTIAITPQIQSFPTLRSSPRYQAFIRFQVVIRSPEPINTRGKMGPWTRLQTPPDSVVPGTNTENTRLGKKPLLCSDNAPFPVRASVLLASVVGRNLPLNTEFSSTRFDCGVRMYFLVRCPYSKSCDLSGATWCTGVLCTYIYLFFFLFSLATGNGLDQPFRHHLFQAKKLSTLSA